MQIEDSEFEVLAVAVAVGVSLEGSDLTVDYFELAGADTVFVPVQDKRLPCRQLAAEKVAYSDHEEATAVVLVRHFSSLARLSTTEYWRIRLVVSIPNDKTFTLRNQLVDS